MGTGNFRNSVVFFFFLGGGGGGGLCKKGQSILELVVGSLSRGFCGFMGVVQGQGIVAGRTLNPRVIKWRFS